MNKFLKKKIPLYEFDEHNEAFYFLHAAKSEGYICEPLDFFHVDAHNDMAVPGRFKKSVYFSRDSKSDYLKYYRYFVKKELGINNFILPAVLNGFIKNIYFIYPEWRRFKPLKRKLNISTAFGEGKAVKYNTDIKDVSNPAAVFKALPDLKRFNYYACTLDKMPQDKKVILDIDADFFACRDSVQNRINYELEITREQFLNKKIFLSDKTLDFSGLDFYFKEKNKKYYAKIAYKKTKDLTYLPAKDQITSEIRTFAETLQNKNIRPAMIMICKSCISGYCPKDHSGFITNQLKGI